MRQNNKLILLLLSTVCLAGAMAKDVNSLRGSNSINNDSKNPVVKNWINDDIILDRSFIQQPPLIPHKIENYHVTANSNKCLDCHSWENAKDSGATKVSLTHFKDRDDNELSSISPRRYFCTQCHVPQRNAKPLVDNEYETANQLK